MSNIKTELQDEHKEHFAGEGSSSKGELGGAGAQFHSPYVESYRCQFHQRFLCVFFVRTSPSLVTCKLPKQHSYEEFVRKTLMKLTAVVEIGQWMPTARPRTTWTQLTTSEAL